MKFQFLGTAAAEGWPAIFCNCPACKEAERLGGKNIRTRSQALINDDLLIDLPPDTYMHKLLHRLDLTRIQHLVITHKHMDHFYPQELTVRGSGYSHAMVSDTLNIYCAQETKDYFYQVSGWELDKASDDALLWHILTPYQTVQAGSYQITPLPAVHMAEGNQPLMYHIKDADGKQVLYLHDSGYYTEDIWQYFSELSTPVDLVSFDSTYGAVYSHRARHMGIEESAEVKERLRTLGAIDDHTKLILNHFSHNGHLMHDDMLSAAAAHQMDVSYDGMILEI